MNVPFVNDVGAIPARSQARSRARALKEDSMAISLAVRIGGLVLGAALLLALGLSGPSPRVADAQAPWVAPASEKAKKNPLPSYKKTVDQGEKVAKINCASCHGARGRAEAPAPPRP